MNNNLRRCNKRNLNSDQFSDPPQFIVSGVTGPGRLAPPPDSRLNGLPFRHKNYNDVLQNWIGARFTKTSAWRHLPRGEWMGITTWWPLFGYKQVSADRSKDIIYRGISDIDIKSHTFCIAICWDGSKWITCKWLVRFYINVFILGPSAKLCGPTPEPAI